MCKAREHNQKVRATNEIHKEVNPFDIETLYRAQQESLLDQYMKNPQECPINPSQSLDHYMAKGLSYMQRQ